jgi:hypothetical protein
MDPNVVFTAIVNNGFGPVCAAAILIFAWLRETKTIPKMMETFQAVNKETQEAFSKRNDDALQTFATLTREERTTYQKWHEENRDRLDRMFLEQKEGRHIMLNLAHQLGLRQAVEEKMREERAARHNASEDSSAVPPRKV